MTGDSLMGFSRAPPAAHIYPSSAEQPFLSNLTDQTTGITRGE